MSHELQTVQVLLWVHGRGNGKAHDSGVGRLGHRRDRWIRGSVGGGAVVPPVSSLTSSTGATRDSIVLTVSCSYFPQNSHNFLHCAGANSNSCSMDLRGSSGHAQGQTALAQRLTWMPSPLTAVEIPPGVVRDGQRPHPTAPERPAVGPEASHAWRSLALGYTPCQWPVTACCTRVSRDGAENGGCEQGGVDQSPRAPARTNAPTDRGGGLERVHMVGSPVHRHMSFNLTLTHTNHTHRQLTLYYSYEGPRTRCLW